MMMMLMPIHVGVPWLSFLASLSGSRAHRDTCVPPVTELWKFFGFKHCSLIHFHFHICYCYHRAELFAWVLNSPPYHSNMNSLCASTPTQPCAHQILCAIHLVEVDKKFTWQGWTLLKTPCLDTWNDIAHESLKMSFWKEKKKFHRIVFGFSLISSFLAGLAGRYVAKIFDWSSSPIADLMMRTISDPWDKLS